MVPAIIIHVKVANMIRNYKVTGKTLLANDSVEYTFDVLTIHDFHGNCDGDPPFTDYDYSNSSIAHSIRDEYISPIVPEEFNHLLYGSTQNYISYDHNCGYRMTIQNDGYYPVDSLGCFDNWHSQSTSKTYISNAGSYYSSCYDPQNGGCDYGTYASGHVHNGNSCGNLFYVSINDEPNGNVNLFPNPTTGLITVNTAFEIYTLSVYDISGKLVFSDRNAVQLDLSFLDKGLYIIKISDGDTNVNRRIIRQ